MFKKSLPIIFIGLCVVVAALVLGWSVFVKEEVVVPVQAPVVDDENNKIIPNDIVSDGIEDDNVLDDVDNGVEDNGISEIDISDWKTYRNEIIGIEFKYPRDWNTLKPDDVGDTMKNGKRYNSFFMNLPDASHLNHTLLNYENMPIDIQYEAIKCRQDSSTAIECKEEVSSNGVKYVWSIEKTKGDLSYGAMVATGKYILIFDFQEKENYEKRADQYQRLLSTLKIPE